MVCVGLALSAMAVQAEVSVSVVRSDLVVGVPAEHAGDRVVLCWGDTDGGADTNAWTHVQELTQSVPADGGRYTFDLNAAGVSEGQVCRVTLFSKLNLLETLGTFSSTAYVDTGIKDTDCYGVSFGFYATSKTTDWGYFIGSNESTGFVVGNNSGNFNSWNWAYRNGKKQPRPSVYTDRINEAVFGSGKFVLNGSDVNSSLDAGSVGTSGNAIRIGRTTDSRMQYGWWSHVSLSDSNGEKLIDFVPVQFPGSGKVAFYNCVSGTYVYSSGGGEFTAGPVTNTVERLAYSRVFQPKDFEQISVSVADAKLTAKVPAHFAGNRVVLVWDDADKGNEPSSWANSEVLVQTLPNGGTTLTADLLRKGVRNGQVVSVIVVNEIEPLDKVMMSVGAYVDAGFTDAECTRAAFGFYAEASDYTTTDVWGIFLGTGDGNSADMTGFVFSLANGNPETWYWKACGYRSGSDRPTVSKTAINEAVISKDGLFVNGATVRAGLNAATLGTKGANIYLGKGSLDYRHQAGWWSHFELAGVDGRNLVEYIPARRTNDGNVGFYDRVSGRFVGSSSAVACAAGTATNVAFTVVGSRATVVPRIDEPLKLSVADGVLSVEVPAAYSHESLVIRWGDRSAVLKDVIPAGGGTYAANLAALGIGSDDVCTVATEQNLRLLDQLKMPNQTTYVDTGIPDSLCHLVEFGFYGNEGSDSFGCLIGTYEGDNDATLPGFVIGMDNARFESWYWAYQGIKYYPRPTVKTDAINEVTVGNGSLVINGGVVNENLPPGPVGNIGLNMFLGAWQPRSRFLHGWWSYVRFSDAGGNIILDYLPAQRVDDGSIGFFDRATGRFVMSIGLGDFTAGTVTNAAYAAMHASRTFTVGGLVATAIWTGAGAGPLDPASWTCRNPDGETVAGLPTSDSAVVVPTGLTLSVPADAAFVCRSFELPAELTGDCDLSGVSFARVIATSVDLKGHALSLSLDAEATREASLTDSVGGGTVRLNVPDGKRMWNTGLSLAGALKVVKAGGGWLIADRKGQTYTGGTEIAEGTFICGGKGSEGVYGAPDGTLTVRSGATLECDGHDGHSAAKLVLDGGTVANSNSGPFGCDWFADVTLTADSFARADRALRFAKAGGEVATLEMNGHTLTLDIDGNHHFGMVNVTVTGGGTINQRTGGFLRLGDTGLSGVTAETTTLKADRSLGVASDSVFLNYISTYGGNWDDGAAFICVKGRFCPRSARWHSTKLLDGATLDLSAQTGVWSATTTAEHFASPAVLAFAANANVTVDVGERQPVLNDQLVAWQAKPAGVKFAWSLDLPLLSKARGLFVMERKGLYFIAR